jgi:predicted Zn-dependent peptidase
MERFHHRTWPNGLTLVAQEMPDVSSSALALSLPAGAAREPNSLAGASSVVCEWLFRGAGQRDTRQLNDAFDALGCHHHESVRPTDIVLSAALLGRNLPQALTLLADVVRRPRLDEATFNPCRELVAQDLDALADEPARHASLLLRERFYPRPLGRCIFGRAETLQAMTPQAVREHASAALSPSGAVLAVAGHVAWDELCDQVERTLGDWSAPAPPRIETAPAPGGVTHQAKDSAQVHLAMGFAAPPISHELYYPARVGEVVLSGGMASRLPAEVRERRGLVYHIGLSYHRAGDQAGFLLYAGTKAEFAQETFDVTLAELARLAEGVSDPELSRARTQLKSSLVMQGESTRSRASALLNDWLHLGRLRSLDEMASAVEAVTAGDLARVVRAFPMDRPTVLVIGPAEIDTSHLPSSPQ